MIHAGLFFGSYLGQIAQTLTRTLLIQYRQPKVRKGAKGEGYKGGRYIDQSDTVLTKRAMRKG